LHTEVAIIGAGLAGLTCARRLAKAGRDILLVEGDARVGGRVQTDEYEGFLLDRGFQVLQKAYPTARQLLDYRALDLKSYPAGARIRAGGRFQVFAHPLRSPQYLIGTLSARIGTIGDRLRLLKLARAVCRKPLEQLFEGEEMLAKDYLEHFGFSQDMIERFFVPFFAGICLDPSIRVTHRFLLFVLRMFAQDDVAVPARGIGQIPLQLAKGIPAGRILLGSPVAAIDGRTLILEEAGVVSCEALVVATPGPETARLLGQEPIMESCREICLYFSAADSPTRDPLLILNGERRGVVNNVSLPSLVSAAYAPPDETLIAAVILGDRGLSDRDAERTARDELADWFGPQVQSWRLLRSYDIRHALPRPVPPTRSPFSSQPDLGNGCFISGEYGSLPSIEWAMRSGVRTAEAVERFLGRHRGSASP
jgi:phytoene dehydrogenase-like protein